MSNERLDYVEERLAWLERHVVEQDKAMLEYSRELDRLRAEVKRLAERPSAGGGDPLAGMDGAASPADERPPHY
ncbi:MAG: SlyX family protein [Verrucomicrobiota bacterium]